LGQLGAAFVVLLGIAAVAAPANADNWRHRHHDGGSFSFGLSAPGYYYEPAPPTYYYTPPPTYYYTPPPPPAYYYPPPAPRYYYYDPGPSINFDLGIGSNR
jgi:hypothetical protein